jgi:hypothetical protein
MAAAAGGPPTGEYRVVPAPRAAADDAAEAAEAAPAPAPPAAHAANGATDDAVPAREEPREEPQAEKVAAEAE